jgi:hypothetical protein
MVSAELFGTDEVEVGVVVAIGIGVGLAMLMVKAMRLKSFKLSMACRVKLYVPAVVGVPKRYAALLDEYDAPLGGAVKKQ